jgi:signal transduction histidine kinase
VLRFQSVRVSVYKATDFGTILSGGNMSSRVASIALRGHIQHRRVRGAAVTVLFVRLLEGAASWAIVFWFFCPATVPAWAVHLNFAAYVFANVALFFPQRHETLTPTLVWLDIIVNLLPMAAAAVWSGGLYSPLLPIFVLKIGSYALVFGVDVGIQSLAATTVAALGLAGVEATGFGVNESIDEVPLLLRQRLTLGVAGLTFGIGVGFSFRFFRLLQDREGRLADALREKDQLYHASLQHQQHLQRLSRKMMQVSEATMRRLARELHDDLGQALTAVKMDLGLIDRHLPPDSPVRSHVREARERIGTLLQSVRNLSQLLRPAVLDDLGLIPAMQSYVASFEQRTQIHVTLESPSDDTRLPRPLEVTLYRVLQEALTNVARHAHAQHVIVRLHAGSDAVRLQISDDGCGFDAARLLHSPPAGHGMGVIGMRERVATYNGLFSIDSRPGTGTRVDLSVSLRAPVDGAEEEYTDDSHFVG